MKRALALHLVGLDEEDVAAGRRPGQAYSHAGPLHALLDLGIHAHLDVAQEFADDFAGEDELFLLAFDHAPRFLAADGADDLLEFADAGFARVVANQVAHRVLGKLDLLRRDPVFLDLARNQVAVGDVQLLLFAVALERNDFHAVQQRRRHGVEHVGGADEQHLRQIERHVEIVVAERVVLLRIERLEQGRGRVAAEVAAQLVDFVQHDHRVVGFGAANALDDLARQRADVGAPVAADFGLVVHAAQRDALELAAQRAGDGAAQAGLAHARRSDKAQDRALHVGLELEHAAGSRGCGP